MTEVQKIIRKHYTRRDKWGKSKTYGWEQCGNEIYNLIRKKQEVVRAKNLPYSEQCKAEAAIQSKIEREYEYYFGQTNLYGVVAGYNWIKGNSRLAELLTQQPKRAASATQTT